MAEYEHVHGMFVKVFVAHMRVCSKLQPHYIPKMVHETN